MNTTSLLENCSREQLLEVIDILTAKIAEVQKEIWDSGGGACCGQGNADDAFREHPIAYEHYMAMIQKNQKKKTSA